MNIQPISAICTISGFNVVGVSFVSTLFIVLIIIASRYCRRIFFQKIAYAIYTSVANNEKLVSNLYDMSSLWPS